MKGRNNMEEKEFEYKEEYAWPTNLTLTVTESCNLACKYCFVYQHPLEMSFDIAKKSVDYLISNIEKKNKKFNKQHKGTINFFGGEPTLKWTDIIVPLVNYVKENNFPIHFSMTSNGTFLTEEKVIFLKENNIGLLLSMDGDEETQNHNRPCHNSNVNSFDLIEPNIKYILKYLPNTMMRATISEDSVQNIYKNYLFAKNKGFKSLFMLPNGREDWSEEKIEIYYVNEFDDYKMGDRVIESYKIGGKVTLYYESSGWYHTDTSVLWSGAGSADNYIWPYWYHIFLA